MNCTGLPSRSLNEGSVLPDKLIHIIDALPPYVGGVCDYGNRLARGLKKAHGIETFFATVKDFGEPDRSWFEHIHSIYPDKQLFKMVSDVIATHYAPDEKVVLLLQYVPHGYEKRGCPLWLLSELKKIKKTFPQVQLTTMFHELYATSNKIGSSTFWLQFLQRHITKSIYRLSDSVVTNSPRYKTILQSWQQRQVDMLPVFSNIGESEDAPGFQVRADVAVVFGSRVSRQRVYHSEQLGTWIEALGITRLIDIGPGEANVSAAPVEVETRGVLEASEICTIMQQVKYGFINNGKRGALEKSGVFASYAANAVCPVVLDAYQGESVYLSGIDYLGSPEDYDKTDSIADSAKKSYKLKAALQVHLDYYCNKDSNLFKYKD